MNDTIWKIEKSNRMGRVCVRQRDDDERYHMEDRKNIMSRQMSKDGRVKKARRRKRGQGVESYTILAHGGDDMRQAKIQGHDGS